MEFLRENISPAPGDPRGARRRSRVRRAFASKWWRVIPVAAIALMAAVMIRSWRLAPGGLEGDFSPYWVSGWWIREHPDRVPLYYPEKNPGEINASIWTCGSIGRENAYDAWRRYGRRHDFGRPKFYLYPPVFALLMAPLTHLKVETAVRLWGLLNGLAFIGSACLTARMISLSSRVRWAWTAVFLAAGLFCYPLAFTLQFGQNSPQLFFLAVLAMYLLWSGWPVSAGALLGGLALVKLAPVLFLPWLAWRRQWRALASAVVTILALIGISAVAVGFEELRTYFLGLVPLLGRGTYYHHNQSLLGFFLRASDATRALAGTVEPGRLGGLAATGFRLAVASALLFELAVIGGPSHAAPRRLLYEFAHLQLLLFLVGSVSWSHHYIHALLPLALMARRIAGRADAWVAAKVAALTFLWVLLWNEPRAQHWIATHGDSPWISLRLYAAIALWLWMGLWGIRHPPCNPHRPVTSFPALARV